MQRYANKVADVYAGDQIEFYVTEYDSAGQPKEESLNKQKLIGEVIRENPNNSYDVKARNGSMYLVKPADIIQNLHKVPETDDKFVSGEQLTSHWDKEKEKEQAS